MELENINALTVKLYILTSKKVSLIIRLAINVSVAL